MEVVGFYPGITINKPGALPASRLAGAKVLGHKWCSSCKSMSASEQPGPCIKCGNGTDWKPQLEKSVI